MSGQNTLELDAFWSLLVARRWGGNTQNFSSNERQATTPCLLVLEDGREVLPILKICIFSILYEAKAWVKPESIYSIC